MSNLVKIDNVTSLKDYSDNANFDLITDLEYLLRKAKLGELHAFIGTAITSDNSIEHIRAGDWHPRINSLIGMLEDAKYELLQINNGDL